MSRLIRKLLACILILFSVLLTAQNNYSDKTVNLPAKRVTLKAALKILSDQTGCVFSYDPTKIDDKQELVLSKCSRLTLQAALQKILQKNIRFKLNGKYVVLQKVDITKTPAAKPTQKNEFQQKQPVKSSVKTDIVVSEITTNKGISESKANSIELLVDSVKQNEEIIQANPTPGSLVKTDSVYTPLTIKSDLQPIASHSPDTLKITKPKFRPVFEMELTANHHVAAFSTHIGLNNVYSVISIGTDYYKSQHLGVGAGINIKLYKHFGANIDLIQYALIAGRSAKIKIRAKTTQLSAALNYSIGQRLKVFAGSSVYQINSKYVRGGSNTNLGRLIECSAILGIKIDLAKRQKRNS